MQHLITALGADLRVSLVDAYSDGTVWARLEDGGGRKAVACIDGRAGRPTQYRLFQGARHPNKPEAVLIELGAVEEGIVVPLISRWLDSDESRKELTSYGREIVQDTLLRLGDST
jgi:hypothetical protein